MGSVRFGFDLAWAAASAAFSDLGTNGLGWMVALVIPFLVVLLKIRSKPSGSKWAFICSQWRTELRDAALVFIAVWFFIAAWEGLWGLPRKIWSQAGKVEGPSFRVWPYPIATLEQKTRKDRTSVRRKPNGVQSGPLEILDLNSADSIILINDSDKPVFAIGLRASIKSTTIPGEESVSYPLNSEMMPNTPQTFKPSSAGTFETLQPLGKDWAKHWRLAEESYKGCLKVFFYSPSSIVLGQFSDHYRAAGTPCQSGRPRACFPIKTTHPQRLKRCEFR